MKTEGSSNTPDPGKPIQGAQQGSGKPADKAQTPKKGPSPDGSRVSADKHLADMNALAMARGSRFGGAVNQIGTPVTNLNDGSAAPHQAAHNLIEKNLTPEQLKIVMEAMDVQERDLDLGAARSVLDNISAVPQTGRPAGFRTNKTLADHRAAFKNDPGRLSLDEVSDDLGGRGLKDPIAGISAKGDINRIPPSAFSDAVDRGMQPSGAALGLVSAGAKPGDPHDKLVATLAKLSSGEG